MKEKISALLDILQFREPKKPTDFCANGFLTLGVEVELQLLDATSLNLTPRASELLKIAAFSTKKIKEEFYLSTLEINTDKCDDVFVVEKDLTQSLDLINQIAAQLDLKLATTGCHPFSRYSDCVITPSQRYSELIDRNQWLSRRMTVYGLHVHLGMKSGDEAIRFNNFFLNFTAHLLALSASSPFWQGGDTGLASCRSTTQEALPTAGHPYHVKNWREFEQLYEALVECKSISSLKDLWWDIRPSPKFGTLEIRICDGLATLQETLAIVAFIHLLAHWFADNATWLEQVPTAPMWLSRENKWRAMRFGLEAELVQNLQGQTKSVREDILQWLEKLTPYTQKLGYEKYIDDLKLILLKGNSCERQRQVYAKTDSLKEVVKFNVAEFLARTPNYS